MERPPVVARDLRKTFGDVEALRGLSFEARRGEFLGILGPNGAGKTTALHLLLGVLEPTSGEAFVLGLSPWKDKYSVYPRINFSSAYVQLPFNLTVERNLRVFGELYGLADARERIREQMELFDLTRLAKSPTGALSSGEQTRLNLCKSLLNDPEVLFLDEPTASLDPDMADQVRTILKRVQGLKGTTILYTSHNMAEVEALCDRVVFIHEGRAVVDGTPRELREHFGKDSLERVFLHLSRGGKAP